MIDLTTILTWSAKALATWHVAAIIGGALILLTARLDRRDAPTDEDVQRAASRYRQFYGDDAFLVLGDHILGASFAPDHRHMTFLRRVARRLLQESPKPQGTEHSIEL